MDRRDGSRCMKCEIACSNAIEQGSDFIPFLSKKSNVNTAFINVNAVPFINAMKPKTG